MLRVSNVKSRLCLGSPGMLLLLATASCGSINRTVVYADAPDVFQEKDQALDRVVETPL